MDSESDLLPKKHEVLIRMYGQGLGDCFLLAFPRTKSTAAVAVDSTTRPVYVLIDCGVLGTTPGASARISTVIENIRETTRDTALPHNGDQPKGHLDLLVITHEHMDHVSGFQYAGAKALWNQIQVDAVWTAWTAKDDPKGLTGVLRRIRDQQDQALQKIAERASRFGLEDRLPIALSLLSFLDSAREFGMDSVREGLDFAKGLAGKDNLVTCEPGEVRAVPGADSIAYVLGPPKNWTFLSQMDPTAGAEETYENELAAEGDDAHGVGELNLARAMGRLLDQPSSLSSFVIPLLDPPAFGAKEAATAGANASEQGERVVLASAAQDLYDRSFPFDSSLGIPIPTAASQAARQPGDFPALASYFDDVNHWRRIDLDWLLAAEGFALWVDNFINNTSLALAFELPPKHADGTRNVLLFVADAQVGNWLSWDKIETWQPHDGAQPSQSNAAMDELFGRAVFYKVGHHGSHNATLKAKGVERMRSDGKLTAFVPVSAPVAHIAHWDKMPLTNIMNALTERTGGRVVLSNGTVWPLTLDQEAEIVAARNRIGVKASATKLPPKCVKDDCDNLIEGEVPLWVQIAVEY